MLATKRRTREFTGPTPHSVAIRERDPSSQPPDHLILERRRHEDLRREAMNLTAYNKAFDLKNEWEKSTDKLIQRNEVQRRVKNKLQEQQFGLEARRERLRCLLAAEEQHYLQEMESKIETPIERQAKMRHRAKELREKREEERLKSVDDKLDQRWRMNCEELRATLIRRHRDEVCTERAEQIKIREELSEKQRAEDRFFADLWEQDRKKKEEREEREAQEKLASNRETLVVLREQMAALEVQKQEEQRLKEEEAQLLKEEAELRKLEEQRSQQQKLRQQKETRNMLEKSIKLKLKKKAKDVQEELALDLKILESLLEETKNEAMEQAQRKSELRDEQQRYREYLRRQMEEEKVRERELDRMIDEEVRRSWSKKIEQWEMEKAARQKLMRDVMDTRRKQIQERLARNEQEQLEVLKERGAILASIEEHKRLEEENRLRVKNRELKFQDDLIEQQKYKERIAELRKEETHREYLMSVEAEAQYQAKLREALSRPPDKQHPFRIRFA